MRLALVIPHLGLDLYVDRIRNALLDLLQRVAAEVTCVDVDADPGRVDGFHDLDNSPGLCGNAAVVLQTEDHALLSASLRMRRSEKDPAGDIRKSEGDGLQANE